MAKQMEAHLHEESKIWSFVFLFQNQIMNARRRSKERNLTWRIQEDRNCWTHFEYFMESILCILYFISKLRKLGVQRFKRFVNWSWNKEVMAVWRQLHQAVRNFAATKWAAKWNPLVKFRKVFHSCETTSKHTCATSQVETPFSQLRTTLRNHLQAAKSQIQLEKSKFKLVKRIIQCAKSTCAISDICYRLS